MAIGINRITGRSVSYKTAIKYGLENINLFANTYVVPGKGEISKKTAQKYLSQGKQVFYNTDYYLFNQFTGRLVDNNSRNRKAIKDAIDKLKENIIIDTTSEEGTGNDNDAWERLRGQSTFYYQISIDGALIKSELVNIRGNDADAIYWNNIFKIFYPRSDSSIFELYAPSIVRVVIMLDDKIPLQAIKQSFLDGFDYHCVFRDLIAMWESIRDNSESKASSVRANQRVNKLKLLQEEYKNGVPEDKLEEIGRAAARQLIIHDVINNEINSYYTTCPKKFHFTNTRKDHLETGEMFMDKDWTRVDSQEELNKIINEHLSDNVFFHIVGNVKNGEINAIKSVRGYWVLCNENYDLFQEFNKQHKIKDYRIDAIKYPYLNAFVKESRLINSAPTPLCDNPNDIENANHIDIEKAYTQHSKSKYYEGFLGHINQCGRFSNIDATQFLSNHIGIFKFMVIKNTNWKLNKLGLNRNKTFVLPSPEIKYFMDNGVSIRLIAGCWGSKFDINYTQEMLENRRYCIWAGKLGQESTFDSYTFVGDQEWASHLKATLGDENVMFFKDVIINKSTKSTNSRNYIIIKKDKNVCYTTHHILSFITSYTRINMLTEMAKIKEENLIKVILDGIYFRGEMPDVEIPHSVNKELKTHLGFRDAWYYQDSFDESVFNLYDSKLDLGRVVVLTGQGGSGKSHSILSNKNYINPLFVVPSHILGKKCRSKYGCNYTTINKLIGAESIDKDGKKKKCLAYKEIFGEPGLIFIDELTMIEADWIQKAIDMYPNTQFFIAGDVDKDRWYQCRNGHPGQFSKIFIPKDYPCVEYLNDYRSQDDELKQIKLEIRSKMREIFKDGGQTDASKMNSWAKKRFNCVNFWDAVKMFQPGDTWIAGTHKTNKDLLSVGVVSGYINKQKEIVKEEDGEKRGSFTTHSFQGLTIENGKIFISLDFFEYAMLYTSVSRAVNFNQIIFVN